MQNINLRQLAEIDGLLIQPKNGWRNFIELSK